LNKKCESDSIGDATSEISLQPALCFERVTQIWCPVWGLHKHGDYINLGRNSEPKALKSTQVLLSISSNFGAIHSWKICIASLNWKLLTKTPYFGGSRSSMLVPPKSSAVLVMISSTSVCLNCRNVVKSSDTQTIRNTVLVQHIWAAGCQHSNEQLTHMYMLQQKKTHVRKRL